MKPKIIKPKIFIGSSSEGIDIAYAIQENLDLDADVTVWNQGIFELSTTTIMQLEKSAGTFHFAIFVFHPDDIIFSRSKKSMTARDNVIFETGLFIGKLGMNKTYMVKPRNRQMKLPSDLLGVTFGNYDADRTDLKAASAPFCNQVREMIRKYFSAGLSDLNNKKVIENKIRYQIKILNKEGDSVIEIMSSITPVKSPLSHRKHEAFSDSNFMNVEEMELRAWDKNKNELDIVIEKNTPNRKNIKINFRENIKPNATVVYSFSYKWKKMFPSKEEYFLIKKTSAQTTICLHFPKEWLINYIKAEPEPDNDDDKKDPVVLTKKKSSVKENFRIEEYAFKEATLNSNVIVSWKRK